MLKKLSFNGAPVIVTGLDPNQQQQTLADTPHTLAGYRHRGFADTLQQHFQSSILLSSLFTASTNALAINGSEDE